MKTVEWAEKEGSDYLFVETAGLCLRCSPYVENSLGIVVLEATSGMNLPRKVGPMLTLADIAVITKIDLVSQAEREVFRYRVLEAAHDIFVVESNALYGIGIDPIVKKIEQINPLEFPMFLRGNPPVGTCTICVGKKEIGGEKSFRCPPHHGPGTLLYRGMTMKRIYLDNAASTPMDPAVIREITRTMTECPGNASSLHGEGIHAREILERSRSGLASILKCHSGEIIFTSGGTEIKQPCPEGLCTRQQE